VDEIIWVKTNLLKKIIRTGRTGSLKKHKNIKIQYLLINTLFNAS
jgi:hypothetical protein